MEKRQKKILSFLNKLDDQKLELLYQLLSVKTESLS